MTADAGYAGSFAWDRSAATCANSYCHAPFPDTKAAQITPVWTKVGQGQAAAVAAAMGFLRRDTGRIPVARPATGPRSSATSRGPRSTRTDTSTSRRQPGPAWAATGAATTRRLPSTCSGSRIRASRPSARTASTSRRCTRSALRWPAASATSCRRQYDSPGHIDHQPPAEVFPPDAGVLARADGAPVLATTRPPRPAPPTVTGRERAWRRTPPRASTGRRPSTEGRARRRAAAATGFRRRFRASRSTRQDPRRLPHLPPEHRRFRRQHHRGRRRRLHARERSNRVTPGRSLPGSLPGARGGDCRRGRKSLLPPSHRRKGCGA